MRRWWGAARVGLERLHEAGARECSFRRSPWLWVERAFALSRETDFDLDVRRFEEVPREHHLRHYICIYIFTAFYVGFARAAASVPSRYFRSQAEVRSVRILLIETFRFGVTRGTELPGANGRERIHVVCRIRSGGSVCAIEQYFQSQAEVRSVPILSIETFRFRVTRGTKLPGALGRERNPCESRCRQQKGKTVRLSASCPREGGTLFVPFDQRPPSNDFRAKAHRGFAQLISRLDGSRRNPTKNFFRR
jgi:hypothetical protein